MSNLKTCRVCNTPQSIDQFSKDKNYKDGLSSRCKICAKDAYAKYYSENSDKVNSSCRARNINKQTMRVRTGVPINKASRLTTAAGTRHSFRIGQEVYTVHSPLDARGGLSTNVTRGEIGEDMS